MFSFLRKKKIKALGGPLDPTNNLFDEGSFRELVGSLRKSKYDEKSRLDELWNIMRDDKQCLAVINKHNLTRESLGTYYELLAAVGYMGTPAFFALADAEMLDYMQEGDLAAINERMAMFCKKHGV